jgi:hypothetical protein
MSSASDNSSKYVNRRPAGLQWNAAVSANGVKHAPSSHRAPGCAPVQEAVQAAALHQLLQHAGVRRLQAGAQELDDAGVREAGQHRHLRLEARQLLRTAHVVQHLDGHRAAARAAPAAAVDGAERAGAQQRIQLNLRRKVDVSDALPRRSKQEQGEKTAQGEACQQRVAGGALRTVAGVAAHTEREESEAAEAAEAAEARRASLAPAAASEAARDTPCDRSEDCALEVEALVSVAQVLRPHSSRHAGAAPRVDAHSAAAAPRSAPVPPPRLLAPLALAASASSNASPLGRREAPTPTRRGCGCGAAPGCGAPPGGGSDGKRGSGSRPVASAAPDAQGDSSAKPPEVPPSPPVRVANVTCRSCALPGGSATAAALPPSPRPRSSAKDGSPLRAPPAAAAAALRAARRRSTAAPAAPLASPPATHSPATRPTVRGGTRGCAARGCGASSAGGASGAGSGGTSNGAGGGAAGRTLSPQQYHTKPQPVSCPAAHGSAATPNASGADVCAAQAHKR